MARLTYVICDRCKCQDDLKVTSIRLVSVKLNPGIESSAELCQECRVLLCDAIREGLGEDPCR